MKRYKVRWAGFALAFSVAACVQTNAPALDYATVLDAQPAKMAGENTGAGGLVGAGVGGVVGSRFGSGAGTGAATAAGVVVGALVGSKAEAALQNTDAIQYTLRLDDGRVMTIVQHREDKEAVLGPGTRVVIRTVGRVQRVLPSDQPVARQ